MKTNQEIAREIMAGKWGNGQERRRRITAAGYDFDKIQTIVNALVYGHEVPEDEQKKAPLEIDYDPQSNEGIIINIIV